MAKKKSNLTLVTRFNKPLLEFNRKFLMLDMAASAEEENVIRENLDAINEMIESVRSPSRRVLLVAVSKQATVDQMLVAARLGVHCFGENRVKDGIAKKEEFLKQCPPEIDKKKIEWHLIGHLQSNKARIAVENFDVIHSLDSVKLAEKIEDACISLGKRQMEVLIEVNVSGEESKYGMPPLEVKAFIGCVAESCPHIDVLGLMTVAPEASDPELVRPVFRELKKLSCENGGLRELSMGMTDDWRVALDEGATMLRIGRGIFGTTKCEMNK